MTAKPEANAAPQADAGTELSAASERNSPMLITLPKPPLHLPMSMPSDDASFDAWLRRALLKAHDAVLHDPVPDRLLRILQDPPGH